RRAFPSLSVICCVPSSRSISSAIWSVTSAQMSTTLLYRSPSGMRPLLYLSSISRTAPLGSSRRRWFAGRVTLSLLPLGGPGLGRLLVAEVLQPVGEDDRRLVAGAAVREVDQRAELLLLHHLVDVGEGDLRRDDLVEEHTADGAVCELVVATRGLGDADLDLR